MPKSDELKKYESIASFCDQTTEWIKENCREAFESFKRDSDSGEALKLMWLGDCYYYGYGTEKDSSLAVQCYKKAISCKENSPDRDVVEYKLYELGECYELGRGTVVDRTTALKCFEVSAKAGNVLAMRSCGELYSEYFKNMEKAVEYYTLAANEGNTTAMVILGNYYTGYTTKTEDGSYVLDGHREEYTSYDIVGFIDTIDAKKGFEWYKKADAKIPLACCYYEGVGTAKNWAKAVEIFQSNKDSVWFNHYAADALYRCYATGGYGIEKNLLKAAKWLAVALLHS